MKLEEGKEFWYCPSGDGGILQWQVMTWKGKGVLVCSKCGPWSISEIEKFEAKGP